MGRGQHFVSNSRDLLEAASVQNIGLQQIAFADFMMVDSTFPKLG